LSECLCKNRFRCGLSLEYGIAGEYLRQRLSRTATVALMNESRDAVAIGDEIKLTIADAEVSVLADLIFVDDDHVAVFVDNH